MKDEAVTVNRVAEIAAILLALPLDKRAKSLQFYLHDSALTEDEKVELTAALLADIPARDAGRFTPGMVKDFENARALGMSMADTAAYLGISLERLECVLAGKDIAPGLHKQLLQANMRAEAKCKKSLLTCVFTSAEEDWKAALAVLERRYPEEWASCKRYDIQTKQSVKQSVDMTAQTTVIDVSHGISSEFCQRQAALAEERLRKLRAEREDIDI